MRIIQKWFSFFFVFFLLFNGESCFSSQFTIKIKLSKLFHVQILFASTKSSVVYLSAFGTIKCPHLKYYTSVMPDLNTKEYMHSLRRGDDDRG